MEIRAVGGDIVQIETGALVVNLFQDVKEPGGATGAVDRALDGYIQRLIADGEIRGTKGEITLLHSMGKLPTERVVIVGLGKQEKFDRDVVRSVAADVGRFLRRKRPPRWPGLPEARAPWPHTPARRLRTAKHNGAPNCATI